MITTNLEQSRKLKELGAPQNTELGWFERLDYSFCDWTLDKDGERSVNYTVAAYTLSDLIEWLGYSFTSLYRESGLAPGNWSATKEVPGSSMPYSDAITRYGETPIDALVALAEAIKPLNPEKE
jgi:hypothetical protein